MRTPHGSDWSSIREAGIKPDAAGTRPARLREQATTDSASEGTLTHRHVDQADAGSEACPTWERLWDWRRAHRPVFTPNKPGGEYRPTVAQDGQQERSNHLDALRASRARAEQVPATCVGAGGMVQEAKAWGKAPGYADVDPTIWKGGAPVGVEMS